ncbi:MAG: peptide deformylase [Opitutaceae bacterium]
MSLPIVHFNSPILRKKGLRVTVFDNALRTFAQEMIATMQTAAGIGLAAQQVGRALQLGVVDLRKADATFSWELDGAKPPLDLFMPMIIANPEVTPEPNTEEFLYEEGCLSFPKIRGDVPRPDVITVKYQDEHGAKHVLRCDDLLGRCIQHEVDHLNGILFIDRMEKPVRTKLDPAIKALAKETRQIAAEAR